MREASSVPEFEVVYRVYIPQAAIEFLRIFNNEYSKEKQAHWPLLSGIAFMEAVAREMPFPAQNSPDAYSEYVRKGESEEMPFFEISYRPYWRDLRDWDYNQFALAALRGVTP